MNSQRQASIPLDSYMIPGGGFQYTGLSMDDVANMGLPMDQSVGLGLLDESGSTRLFKAELEACAKKVVQSLSRSPRKDNLFYRQCHFGTRFREFHGFMPVLELAKNLDQYDGCYQSGGETHLFDAADEALQSLVDYCAKMAAKHYLCNAFYYEMTDGADYGSTLKIEAVRKRIALVRADERIESLVAIKLGINDDPEVQRLLKEQADFCGFDQYLPVKDASDATLDAVAFHVSQTFLSQSKHLGTGGPSQPLPPPPSLTF